jgi:hypothetical protein
MCSLIACSGAMYAGVPTVMPVAVWNIPLCRPKRAFAMPKSAILICPSLLSMRFSGLRSRWTMPSSSACDRPASSPSNTPATCASERLPVYGRSDPRGRYSIAMYGVPACSKKSWTVTTFEWLIEPASRASWTNRFARAGSGRWNVPSSLTATSRRRSVWRAR